VHDIVVALLPPKKSLPSLKGFSLLVELEIFIKKPTLTVSRKTPETKVITFKKDIKLKLITSVFSVLIYIFGEIT
jgi:hypothetical protein